MTRRFAWEQFRNPLELEVCEVRLDGEQAAVVESSPRRVRLDGRDWQTAEVQVRVSTVEPRPGALGPLLLSAHALLSSPATQARFPFRLDEVDVSAWEGLITFQRSEVGGSCELGATITGADDQRRPLLRGVTEPWTIMVELGKAPAAPTQAPVRSEWVDFGGSDAPALCRSFATSPYAVVMDGTSPILYLNKACRGFEKLLMAEYAQLEKRRLRDLYATQIAASVTRCLVKAALDELVSNSNGSAEPVPSSEPLFGQACEGVAAMLPSVADVQHFYVRVLEAEEQGAVAMRRLWSEIELAIDVLTNASSMIVEISEEVR